MVCVVGDRGMTFSVEDKAHNLQASATLNQEDFDEFALVGQDLHLRLSLPMLFDCVRIFGAANLALTSLSMTFEDNSDKFKLLLEEDGVVVECELTVHEGEDSSLDFSSLFADAPVTNKAIIKSECLRSAFAELTETPG